MHDYNVVLTWEAIYDVTDITDYIEAEFGQARADRFQNEIQDQIKKLRYMSGTFPKHISCIEITIFIKSYFLHPLFFMYAWIRPMKFMSSVFCGSSVTGCGYLSRNKTIHIRNNFRK